MHGIPIKSWVAKAKAGSSHDVGVRVGKVYHNASSWLGEKRTSVSSRIKEMMKSDKNKKNEKDEQPEEKHQYPVDSEGPFGPFGW